MSETIANESYDDDRSIQRAVEPAPSQRIDPLLYRIVVGSLGLAVLLTLVAIFVLALYGKTVPEGMVALGSVSAGALAGMLVPSPAQ